MSDIIKITQVTEGDLRGKKIAELSDRPNQPSGFSQGLTAQELKERFDAFPDVVKEKINEIIEMLSSEDATEYFSIESPKYKTLREFLSLFGEKSSADGLNIVDFIYARYALENETSKRWHSLSQIFDQIKADIAELKAGVQPPDDGEDDGGETPPTPPEGGDDGGETPPTPPDDGGDDGGGTTPPEGGDGGGETPPNPPEGGDDGEDTPTGEYVEKYFTGASLDVPSDVAETARIVSVGSRALVSRNIYPSNEPIALSKSDVFSEYLHVAVGETYDCYFEFETSDKNVSVEIKNMTRTGSGSSGSLITKTIDSLNPKVMITRKIAEGTEQIYFKFTVSGSWGASLKAPIVVPHGEPALPNGQHGATIIQGYQGDSSFVVPNDSIKEECPYLGYGYSDYLNTIDFESGEYVQYVSAIADDGVWEKESDYVFKKTIPNIEAAEGADAIYCNLFRSSADVRSDDIGNSISVNMEDGSAVIRVKMTQILSISAFKKLVSSAKLFYMIRLKDPARYPISEIANADTMIEVSPGSTIRLLDETQENHHKTTIRFLKT